MLQWSKECTGGPWTCCSGAKNVLEGPGHVAVEQIMYWRALDMLQWSKECTGGPWTCCSGAKNVLEGPGHDAVEQRMDCVARYIL